mgnify:CR=1 FL=1
MTQIYKCHRLFTVLFIFLHISLFHSTVSKTLTNSVTQCPSGIKRTHRILKNHLYISIYLFQLTLFQSCNIFSFKFQCTLCDISQPGEQLCYCTFPTAGFSYDSQRFSFFSVKLTSFTALKGFFPLWVNIFVKCSASKSMLIL